MNSRTTDTEPGYITLYYSGELKRRFDALEARLASCDICPRKCGVNRIKGELGFCHSGHLPIVPSYCDHHGEEPVLSGERGSGTIFFGNCNMKCIYCQNYQISQNWKDQTRLEVSCSKIAEIMIYLQDKLECHNINFVSPSHFVPQLVKSVMEAIPMGLKIPLVYNSNAYDSIETLRALDGIIDIYLPDLRYASDKWAKKFSNAPDYVNFARQAIKEMYRQVGDLIVDDRSIAKYGLIIRHLILPNGFAGSGESLKWIADELSTSVTVSIMSQYIPMHNANKIAALSRTIIEKELDEVLVLYHKVGFENGWMQELDSSNTYAPDFGRKGHPFRETDRVIMQL